MSLIQVQEKDLWIDLWVRLVFLSRKRFGDCEEAIFDIAGFNVKVSILLGSVLVCRDDEWLIIYWSGEHWNMSKSSAEFSEEALTILTIAL